jgi:hypothetical protein
MCNRGQRSPADTPIQIVNDEVVKLAYVAQGDTGWNLLSQPRFISIRQPPEV